MSVQLKLSSKLKNSFEYFEVHLPFFHRFVILDLNLHLDYRLQVQDSFCQSTAKQVREHISHAIRSNTIRGFAGKDITQARGQNSEILNRFYGKRQTCTMRPCFPLLVVYCSICLHNDLVSGLSRILLQSFCPLILRNYNLNVIIKPRGFSFQASPPLENL